jgi:hypothetical protein
MFLPAPESVVLLMAVGFFLIVLERLARDDAKAALARKFPNAIAYAELTPLELARWIAFASALAFLVSVGPFAERKLWGSGNFGEPPFNRSVVLREIKDPDGRKRMAIEFCAAYHNVGPSIYVKLGFDGFGEASDFDWYAGPPRIDELKERDIHVIEFDDMFIRDNARVRDDGFAIYFGDISIGPHQSLYALSEYSQQPINYWFGSAYSDARREDAAPDFPISIMPICDSE